MPNIRAISNIEQFLPPRFITFTSVTNTVSIPFNDRLNLIFSEKMPSILIAGQGWN